MTGMSFDIDIDPLPRTELVLDLPGSDWNAELVVPAVTVLSDRMLAQPHLDEVFRLIVVRGGTSVFDSAVQPLDPGCNPDVILRGAVPRHGAVDAIEESRTGLTVVIDSAERIVGDRVGRSAWPVLLWTVGDRANERLIRTHGDCKPARTVADPDESSDRLALVCRQFLDEVAMSEEPEVHRWMDNRLSSLLTGMGYVAS